MPLRPSGTTGCDDLLSMDWRLFHLVNDLAGRNRAADFTLVHWAKLGPAALGLIVVAAWVYLPSEALKIGRAHV